VNFSHLNANNFHCLFSSNFQSLVISTLWDFCWAVILLGRTRHFTDKEQETAI